MYAIIVDGGRQDKVEEGQVVESDYRDSSAGQELRFEHTRARFRIARLARNGIGFLTSSRRRNRLW